MVIIHCSRSWSLESQLLFMNMNNTIISALRACKSNSGLVWRRTCSEWADRRVKSCVRARNTLAVTARGLAPLPLPTLPFSEARARDSRSLGNYLCTLLYVFVKDVSSGTTDTRLEVASECTGAARGEHEVALEAHALCDRARHDERHDARERVLENELGKTATNKRYKITNVLYSTRRLLVYL